MSAPVHRVLAGTVASGRLWRDCGVSPVASGRESPAAVYCAGDHSVPVPLSAGLFAVDPSPATRHPATPAPPHSPFLSPLRPSAPSAVKPLAPSDFPGPTSHWAPDARLLRDTNSSPLLIQSPTAGRPEPRRRSAAQFHVLSPIAGRRAIRRTAGSTPTPLTKGGIPCTSRLCRRRWAPRRWFGESSAPAGVGRRLAPAVGQRRERRGPQTAAGVRPDRTAAGRRGVRPTTGEAAWSNSDASEAGPKTPAHREIGMMSPELCGTSADG